MGPFCRFDRRDELQRGSHKPGIPVWAVEADLSGRDERVLRGAELRRQSLSGVW